MFDTATAEFFLVFYRTKSEIILLAGWEFEYRLA